MRQPEGVHYCLTYADGSIGEMFFITKSFRPDGSVEFEREPDGESLLRDIGKVSASQPMNQVVRARRVELSDYPADRAFRAQWIDTGSAIVVDMSNARQRYRDYIRARRKPMLEALDIDYQRADESEDRTTKRSIAALKQRLRDATADPRIDAAATIEELRQIDPLANV